MNRVDKNGKKKKLNISFIYNEKGQTLEEILKEGYLFYVKNLKR